MASLKYQGNDWASVKSPTKQQPKRGRPPIQSTSDSTLPGDEDSQRKKRVRLAQRAYRNRKDMEVDGLKARIARLEDALDQTTKLFTRLHNLVIGADNVPPKIAIEISRTALSIASVAQKANSGEPLQNNDVVPEDGGSGKSPDCQDATANTIEELVAREIRPTETAQISSSSNPSTTSAPRNNVTSFGLAETPSLMDFSTTISAQQNLVLRASETHQRTQFAALLLRLCLEEGTRLLTSPTMTYDDLHPALSIHLTWVTLDDLRIQSVRFMANNFEYLPEDLDPSVTPVCPNMYRSIEGSDGIVVPRVPKLKPQQLVHGRTRTKISTNLHGFQGEWLEPIDVQEYLEWKRIFLGNCGQSRVLQIAIPETTLADIWTQNADAIFTEEIQRSRILPTLWPFGIESQALELEVPDEAVEAVPQSAESQIPTLVRQNDPLSIINPEQPIVAHALHEYQSQSDVAQYNPSSEFYPPRYAEQFISVRLHLDRFIGLLVGAACCIGPGPGIRKEDVDHALRVSIAVY